MHTHQPLGLIAFGGPQAHVAILRDHLVVQRDWLDEEAFTEVCARKSEKNAAHVACFATRVRGLGGTTLTAFSCCLYVCFFLTDSYLQLVKACQVQPPHSW